jgi:putative transposase
MMLIGDSKRFIKIEAGSQVSDGARAYRVSHIISTDSVIAVDLATNESHKLPVETLKLVVEQADGKPAADRDILDYSEEEWAVGQRRFKAIECLLDNPLRSREETARIAKEHGVHVGTLYRWFALYTNAGHVSALVPSKRGRKVGTVLLKDPIETIVQSAIEEIYLTKQRSSAQEVIDEVKRRCRLAKVAPPHPNTIRNRVNRIPNKERMRRRGRKEEAVNLYGAIRGSFPGADHPFSFVQIDHTPADIIVVDDVHRKPIGRPYITLAIDVYSRMIAGFYLSLDPPSTTSVALCLAQAMCPKREYLAALGVAGTWPVWGAIGTVHCDNAKEFRGKVLERACKDNGINLAWRPVKVPRYGGHIERMMGTLAKELHKLPGTTFSNPKERKGYDSMAEATLTMKELERHLVEFFVNVYHQRVHTQLGMSPLRRWEMGLAGDETKPGLGLMPLPQDPMRLLLDFMPSEERTVQPYGLQIDEIQYYAPELDPHINAMDPENNKRKRLFTVRRDPRDISKVYFFDPTDKRYCVIPYRDIGHPAMSLYELKEVRRRLLEEGVQNVDERLIFEALDKMRTRVAEAAHKSKSARRQAQRSPAREAPRDSKPPSATTAVRSPQAMASQTPSAEQAYEDPFAQPIAPFEELSLRR